MWQINNSFLIEVPEPGGTLKEGVIGIPRFINPVLAVSDADKDLTALTYAGLLRATPEGKLVVDLAKEYSISADGRTYIFTLKDNLTFHDGSPVTTDDIEFTIQKIQDPTIKSPRRAAWDGVTVEKVSQKEIKFILKQPYAPFIDNTTIGILPKQIWRGVPTDEFSFSQLNVSPIGEGPFQVKNIKRNSLGLPVYYNLIAFNKYALGRPFINHIITNFYQNEKELITAYKNGDIDSLNSISPKSATEIKSDDSNIATALLPRIFGVFFNQSQATVFVNKEVRQALSLALDRDRVVSEVLSGFGKGIDGPLLGEFGSGNEKMPGENATGTPTKSATATATSTPPLSRTDQAISLLTKNGWALNDKTGVMEKKTKKETITLQFSLATGDAPELKETAEIIKDSWQKIGASVDVKIFETSDLNQNVIRPRKYDALFFGEVVGRDKDFYPFWHSSQRNDPGLNIALYTNIKTDKLLDEIRTTTDETVRQNDLRQFEKLIDDDAPVAFVYAPEFIYIVPKKVKNIKLGQITNGAERFLNVHEWYIDTNKVWKIFTK